MLCAPFIVALYATPAYTDDQTALAVAFARYCLPQIFFYGIYTMMAQVLNARGHFAAPMFAPIVNNIVAIATYLGFIAIAGTEAAADGMLDPRSDRLARHRHHPGRRLPGGRPDADAGPHGVPLRGCPSVGGA